MVIAPIISNTTPTAASGTRTGAMPTAAGGSRPTAGRSSMAPRVLTKPTLKSPVHSAPAWMAASLSLGTNSLVVLLTRKTTVSSPAAIHRARFMRFSNDDHERERLERAQSAEGVEDLWLSELAGLLDDDVEAVGGVDEGDEGHQGGELVLVVVLGGVRPGLVGGTTGRVGDAGALLGQLQGGALGVGEHRGLPPGRDQVEAGGGLSGVRGVLGVHVGAEAAAIDLTGAERHQVLRRG